MECGSDVFACQSILLSSIFPHGSKAQI
jgi:hypothetical protein